MVELAIMLLAGLGVLVAYCVYRVLKPKDERFAIPVRDVDARKRADELERRLLAMEQDVLRQGDAKRRD